MSYVCLYSHRSYIVMDPLTCGACLGSFASQKFVLSRDTTCASNNKKRMTTFASLCEWPNFYSYAFTFLYLLLCKSQ